MIYTIRDVWLILAGWILGLMYIPDLIKLYKTKDYTRVDFKRNAPLTFAILGFTFNGYVIQTETGNWGTFIAQMKSVIPMMLQYGLTLFYYLKSKKD